MTKTRSEWSAVERAMEGLSERDQAILRDVERVRVLTGSQLQRLHFHDLEGEHKDRTRRRVLGRLATNGILTTLERRIGGARAGSSGLVYTLDLVGQRVMTLLHNGDPEQEPKPRRPGEPTERFLAHCLAISELYVELVEHSRTEDFNLTYYTEPGCWWLSNSGTWVKPDAIAILSAANHRDRWSVEVDRATESLPTLRRKFATYLDLAERGETGPSPVLPKVLVTVPDERRQAAVTAVVGTMEQPADQLFTVVEHKDAASYVVEELQA